MECIDYPDVPDIAHVVPFPKSNQPNTWVNFRDPFDYGNFYFTLIFCYETCWETDGSVDYLDQVFWTLDASQYEEVRHDHSY